MSESDERRIEPSGGDSVPSPEGHRGTSESDLPASQWIAGLNRSALAICQQAEADARTLGISVQRYPQGSTVYDFGVATRGGLVAGLRMAEICMAGRGSVSLSAGERSVWPGAWVQVASDFPVEACMLGQYAGWPVKHEKFFAMGSGPMRLRRGKEPLLEGLQADEPEPLAVGTLECDAFPPPDVLENMAAECQVDLDALHVAVAPTRSVAGCVQVVARSVETALHKMFELGLPLAAVKNAHGIAPIPPATPDFALGIGRTNDAILYGASVSLWLDGDDEQVASIGAQLPSSASKDFGEPFVEIFRHYNYDFYQVDPGLFSPAEVTILNLRSGNSWRFGELRADLIAKSFATLNIV